MSLSAAERAYLRRKYLEEIYDRMSDEDKKVFIRMTMQDKDHKEIMDALQQQKEDIDFIKKKQSFAIGYGSDLLANFTSAGILWLGSKLFKR